MDSREKQSQGGRHKVLEMYTVQVAGKRWDMISNRGTAIDTARRYLLTEDNVMVKDSEGRVIYRHGRPRQ